MLNCLDIISSSSAEDAEPSRGYELRGRRRGMKAWERKTAVWTATRPPDAPLRLPLLPLQCTPITDTSKIHFYSLILRFWQTDVAACGVGLAGWNDIKNLQQLQWWSHTPLVCLGCFSLTLGASTASTHRENPFSLAIVNVSLHWNKALTCLKDICNLWPPEECRRIYILTSKTTWSKNQLREDQTHTARSQLHQYIKSLYQKSDQITVHVFLPFFTLTWRCAVCFVTWVIQVCVGDRFNKRDAVRASESPLVWCSCLTLPTSRVRHL